MVHAHSFTFIPNLSTRVIPAKLTNHEDACNGFFLYGMALSFFLVCVFVVVPSPPPWLDFCFHDIRCNVVVTTIQVATLLGSHSVCSWKESISIYIFIYLYVYILSIPRTSLMDNTRQRCGLLFVVCCLLFVVCCLLFVVCCLLFVVCCLLFVVCCLLFVVVVVVVVRRPAYIQETQCIRRERGNNNSNNNNCSAEQLSCGIVIGCQQTNCLFFLPSSHTQKQHII